MKLMNELLQATLKTGKRTPTCDYCGDHGYIALRGGDNDVPCPECNVDETSVADFFFGALPEESDETEELPTVSTPDYVVTRTGDNEYRMAGKSDYTGNGLQVQQRMWQMRDAGRTVAIDEITQLHLTADFYKTQFLLRGELLTKAEDVHNDLRAQIMAGIEIRYAAYERADNLQARVQQLEAENAALKAALTGKPENSEGKAA